MMNKTKLTCCGISCLLLIAFTGCATAGIMRPMIPMSEQCILTGGVEFFTYLGGVDDSGGRITTFTWGDISIRGELGDYKILPAGKKRVVIVKSYSWVPGGQHRPTWYHGSHSYVSYNYNERWVADFEFEPGKSYSIKARTVGVNIGEGGSITLVGAPNSMYNQHTHTIEYPINHNIEIIEHRTIRTMETIGTYIQPRFAANLGVRFYDYYPGVQLNLGPTLGMQIINGKLNMDIGIEGTAGIGASFGDGDGNFEFGFLATYDYGVYANFALSNDFILGGGAGIGNGYNWYTIYDGGEERVMKSYLLIPYVDIFLGLSEGSSFRKSIPHFGLYGRYYFDINEDNFKKIGIGMKARF
jgi:hypothetical protein